MDVWLGEADSSLFLLGLLLVLIVGFLLNRDDFAPTPVSRRVIATIVILVAVIISWLLIPRDAVRSVFGGLISGCLIVAGLDIVGSSNESPNYVFGLLVMAGPSLAMVALFILTDPYVLKAFGVTSLEISPLKLSLAPAQANSAGDYQANTSSPSHGRGPFADALFELKYMSDPEVDKDLVQSTPFLQLGWFQEESLFEQAVDGNTATSDAEVYVDEQAKFIQYLAPLVQCTRLYYKETHDREWLGGIVEPAASALAALDDPPIQDTPTQEHLVLDRANYAIDMMRSRIPTLECPEIDTKSYPKTWVGAVRVPYFRIFAALLFDLGGHSTLAIRTLEHWLNLDLANQIWFESTKKLEWFDIRVNLIISAMQDWPSPATPSMTGGQLAEHRMLLDTMMRVLPADRDSYICHRVVPTDYKAVRLGEVSEQLAYLRRDVASRYLESLLDQRRLGARVGRFDVSIARDLIANADEGVCLLTEQTAKSSGIVTPRSLRRATFLLWGGATLKWWLEDSDSLAVDERDAVRAEGRRALRSAHRLWCRLGKAPDSSHPAEERRFEDYSLRAREELVDFDGPIHAYLCRDEGG